MKSPNWKAEELKLALEMYLFHGLTWLKSMTDSSPDIVALSKLLKGLDFYHDDLKAENYRSTGSVRMKLANFMGLDPKYKASSLANIGNLDRQIWNEYSNNFDLLQKECRQIIKDHYKGEKSKEINDYYKNHYLDKSEQSDESEQSDTESAFIEEISEKIKSAIRSKTNSEDRNQYMQQLLKLVSGNEKEPEYQEHAGINKKRIGKKAAIKNNTKGQEISIKDDAIGQHVRKTMNLLISKEELSELEVEQLLSQEWSRANFHIKHPMLKEIDIEQPLKNQLIDNNGYVRYWVNPITLRGKQYVICKEWFESGRKYFDHWLNNRKFVEKEEKKKKEIRDLLDFIKNSDRENFIITAETLKNKFGKEVVDFYINKLIDTGVLYSYQGSEREFIIDDYDLLYKMLQHPELLSM